MNVGAFFSWKSDRSMVIALPSPSFINWFSGACDPLYLWLASAWHMDGRTGVEIIFRPYGFETSPSGSEDAVRPPVADALSRDPYRTLYELGFAPPDGSLPPAMRFLQRVSAALDRHLASMPGIEAERERAEVGDVDVSALVGAAPFCKGSEHVDETWCRGIWDRLLAVFREQISTYGGSVASYFAEKDGDVRVPGSLFFSLVEDPDGAEPFAFLASCSPEGGGRHVPLRKGVEACGGDRTRLTRLLSDLAAVAARSDLVRGMVGSGEILDPRPMDAGEAYAFLKEVPLYEGCGVRCDVPRWWTDRHVLGITATVGGTGGEYSGLSTMLSFDPALSVDGSPLTDDEMAALRRATDGLFRLRGGWVEVDRSRLDREMAVAERERDLTSGGVTLRDALRLAGSGGVRYGDWMRRFLDGLSAGRSAPAPLPETFRGRLRPYQEEGFAWLSQMRSLGLGACLADDMGLGKTVQAIALLESARAPGRRALLIVPTSLVGNWKREVDRFAPEMWYDVVRGRDDVPGDAYLTITTYTAAVRSEALRGTVWDIIVADEAQAIKNPDTLQAAAVKSLNGRFRLAMTGTPVENGPWDLWSIFDFIEPGLLGTRAEFAYRLSTVPDEELYAGLRKVTAPFVLRRLKTDKGVIADLPEKQEVKVYVQLTAEQAAMYRKVAEAASRDLNGATASGRPTLLLSSITRLKEVCDHPSIIAGDGGFEPERSGKMETLAHLCSTIRDRGERVIVFTQYRTMAGPISDLLAEVFGARGPVLHGGVPAEERARMVEEFGDPDRYVPYMVLSLRAGGVGLNLSGANHVVHFDRWWNPAVEEQATDRAYRIGQSKDVTVYKLICSGTLEERIDAMIEEKSEMAGEAVSGEGRWISAMSDDEVRDLLRLERCRGRSGGRRGARPWRCRSSTPDASPRAGPWPAAGR